MDLVCVDITGVLASIRPPQRLDGEGPLMALHESPEAFSFNRRPVFHPAHQSTFFGHVTRQGHTLCFIARHDNVVVLLVDKCNWWFFGTKEKRS